MERTETAEIEALRSVFSVVQPGMAQELGVGMLELGEAFAGRVSSAPDAPEVNHALGISTVEQLDALAGFYGDGRHLVSPLPGVDLDRALRERGYEPGYAWMKFARGVGDAPTPETDLDIVEIGADRSDDFGRAVVEGFGMPARFVDWLRRLPGCDGWHCFVAYDRAEPAAGGAMHVFEDLAWFGIGATRPAFRRRGAQNALLAARLRRASDLGCTLLVTETGELVDERPSNSYRNIVRAGFEPQYVRPNYVPTRSEGRAGSSLSTTASATSSGRTASA